MRRGSNAPCTQLARILTRSPNPYPEPQSQPWPGEEWRTQYVHSLDSQGGLEVRGSTATHPNPNPNPDPNPDEVHGFYGDLF